MRSVLHLGAFLSMVLFVIQVLIVLSGVGIVGSEVA